MEIKNYMELFEEYCKASKKYGVYASVADDDINDIRQAVNIPKNENDPYDWVFQLVLNGTLTLFFDAEEECLKIYDNIVCDGPTISNSYNGPCQVYAVMAGPNGIITENT